MAKKISIIIVSYNVRYYLVQCIDSVRKAVKGIDAEIIVVDNHSKDDTVPFLRQHCPDIRLIASQRNLGFSRANNMAIREACGQYVLLLNPDTIIGEDVLSSALDFMDAHPEAGGAGVQMLNSDGSRAPESRRGLPTPWVSMLKMLGCSRRYYMSDLPWDSPQRIEIISGAFFLLRRKALDQVGFLDETFFMYGEDIDLSYRLLKGGWQNWYLPVRILHYKGESTVKSSFRYVHVFYQAMLIFFRKHFGHLNRLYTLPIKIAIYSRALVAFVQMQLMRLHHSLGMTDVKQRPLVIYETAEHSYAEMLQLLAAQEGNRSDLGIKHSDTGILITAKEILL